MVSPQGNLLDQSTDICRNYHGGDFQSEQAHQSIVPSKLDICRRIYDYITQSGRKGRTCYEVEVGLNLKHQTASARMSEMKLTGHTYHIFSNGLKRATSGRATGRVFVTSDGQIA